MNEDIKKHIDNKIDKLDKKIDGLVLIMKGGFDDVQKQFDGVNQQFSNNEKEHREMMLQFSNNEKEHREMGEEMRKGHYKVMDSEDKIAKMLQDKREEYSSTTFLIHKHTDELAEHDRRIKVLEGVKV